MIIGGKTTISPILSSLLGDVIGQGTHGIIYIHKKYPEQVIKVFRNEDRGMKCNEIKENEFDIQKKFYNELKKTDCKIIIPNVYDFVLEKHNCYYEMERILPTDSGKIIIVDMYSDNINKVFSHSNIGKIKSYNFLDFSNSKIDNVVELSFEIGKLFSFLHYVLQYDGYDCELIMGNNYKNETEFYFIDFDKVSSFQFDFNYSVYRKLDETSKREERIIKNENSIASLLFTSMNSMSLIPIKDKLLNEFMSGYKYYLNNENIIQKKVFELVKEKIIDYSSSAM